MGWNHPNPIYYNNYKADDPIDIRGLMILLGLIWIFLGIIPSIFISFIFFPPEKVGLFIPFIIYLIGLILFLSLYLIFEKIKNSSNKTLKWFCGFD